jgi:hypothetical protein
VFLVVLRLAEDMGAKEIKIYEVSKELDFVMKHKN